MHEFAPRNQSTRSIIEAFVSENEASYTDTYDRFSLVHDRSLADASSLDVVIVHPETHERSRLLALPTSQVDLELAEALEAAHIPHFPRKASAGGGSIAFYEVPLQIKPLSQERFFEDNASSDTYVSDKEYFFQLGKLWGKIYKTTGRLPTSSPLAHTALQDFADVSQALIPIPPYQKWQPISDKEHAQQHFEDSVAEELQHINARIKPDELINAIKQGWA